MKNSDIGFLIDPNRNATYKSIIDWTDNDGTDIFYYYFKKIIIYNT